MWAAAVLITLTDPVILTNAEDEFKRPVRVFTANLGVAVAADCIAHILAEDIE